MPVSIFRDRNASRSYPVVQENLQVRTELARYMRWTPEFGQPTEVS